MNKTAKFATALLAFTGVAFSQQAAAGNQRGYLLNQENTTKQRLEAERRADDEWAAHKREATLQHQNYDACMQRENSNARSNPYNCQSIDNRARYWEGMAASVKRPQQQFDTTESTQVLRNLLKNPNIQSRPLPSTQVGQPLPTMPRTGGTQNGNSGFGSNLPGRR